MIVVHFSKTLLFLIMNDSKPARFPPFFLFFFWKRPWQHKTWAFHREIDWRLRKRKRLEWRYQNHMLKSLINSAKYWEFRRFLLISCLLSYSLWLKKVHFFGFYWIHFGFKCFICTFSDTSPEVFTFPPSSMFREVDF